MWSMYIVKCADGSLYTGIAKDVTARVHAHNHTAKGSKHTRARRPVALIKSWPMGGRANALRAEWKMKRLRKAEKLAMIQNGVWTPETRQWSRAP